MSIDVKSDFQIDVSPSTWLKPYSNNSIKHILKMAIFYHVIGLLIAFVVWGAVILNDPSHEIPFYPLTLIDVTTAGPIEESLLFGLPYFLTGNQYVMLGTAILWTLFHVGGLDEDGNFSEEWLTWENFAFVIPTMFFSYRTWFSGKGWLSIVVHSVWNVGAFGVDCVSGEGDCIIYESDVEGNIISVVLILVSAILIGITFWAYRRRERKNEKSNISKVQSSARKLFDETQEKIKDEKRCTICNRLLSEFDKKELCHSCENEEKTS